MKAIMKNPNDKNILLVLNDNESDGTDVSWIWDAHFELLIDEHTKHIYCAGLRAYDMALRLKYEGFKDVEVVENVEDAILKLKEFPEDAYVIALEMEPMSLSIGNFKYKPQRKSKWRIQPKIQPKIALVRESNVELLPLTNDIPDIL